MSNKVIIDRELLMSKLSKIIKFVPAKVVLPAYENIMLCIESNRMTIIASDGNIQIQMRCACNSKTDFAICVSGKWLVSNVALYRENEVVITQKSDTKIEMKSGKSKGTVSLDCFPDGYPLMKMETVSNEINISQFFLRMGLKSAEKFVDEENQNANMTVVNIAEIENKIVFTGTTKALMCRVATNPISISQWKPISIPTETAVRVVGLLEEKGEIGVVHNEKKICFFTDKSSMDAFEIMSTTSNAKFPNTEGLFSNRPPKSISVNTLEFKDAVKRLKFYTEIGMPPKVHITMAGEELKLESADTMTGKFGEEFVSIVNPDGITVDKVYSNEHLIDVLSIVEANEFIFFVSESRNHPSFIIPKVENKEEDIFSFLIANQVV